MPSFRDQMRSYESGQGKRTGRLAVTIDEGKLSALGCTARAMKFYLRGLCIFLVIVAILILALGSYADSANDSIQALGSSFIKIVYMVGAFVLLLGLFGLCGSVRESRLLLFIFTFFLALMFLLLLILGALLLSYSSHEDRVINRFWQLADDDELRAIEYNWFCCGANTNPCLGTTTSGETGYFPSYDDCLKVLNSAGVANSATSFQGQLPYLPCPPSAAGDGSDISGCTPLLEGDFKTAVLGFGISGILLAFICLSGLLSTCCLLAGIKASNAKQEAVKKKSKKAGRV